MGKNEIEILLNGVKSPREKLMYTEKANTTKTHRIETI